MAYDAARPRYTLPLDGEEYDLVGTFELIERIEHAMQDGIILVARRVMEMGMADTAKLAAACTGEDRRRIGATLFRLGLESEAITLLKAHLFFFLRIMLAPEADREEAAEKMGKLIGELTASPGATTGASA